MKPVQLTTAQRSIVKCSESACEIPDLSLERIGRWTHINSAPITPQDHVRETQPSKPGDVEPLYSTSASRHRKFVLLAASKLVATKKRRTPKRKDSHVGHQVQQRESQTLEKLSRKTRGKGVRIMPGLRTPLKDKDLNITLQSVPNKEKDSGRQVCPSSVGVAQGSHTATANRPSLTQTKVPRRSKSQATALSSDKHIHSKALKQKRKIAAEEPRVSRIMKKSKFMHSESDSNIGHSENLTPDANNPKHKDHTHTESDDFDDLAELTLEELASDVIACHTPLSLLSILSPSSVATSAGQETIPPSQQTYLESRAQTMKPFMRRISDAQASQFPSITIPRIIPSLRITTCFRIANILHQLNSPKPGFFVELYAVTTGTISLSSQNLQHIRLADIFFPHRPPYVIGSYNGDSCTSTSKLSVRYPPSQALGQPQALHNSKQNIENHDINAESIVRVILNWETLPVAHPQPASSNVPSKPLSNTQQALPVMKSGEMARVRVQAIWKSNWEEVEYVRGIVDPEGVVADKVKIRSHVGESNQT